MSKLKKIAVVMFIFTLHTASFGQEKEYKQVKELIEQNLKKSINSTDYIQTIDKIHSLSEELKRNFPESPLGYFTSSFYYERTNINVDSTYFLMYRASDKYNQLDDKTQQKLCSKLDLCKETFISNLDSLSVLSLAYYSRTKRSDEVKKFLQKYPGGTQSYNLAVEIYEKLRFTEIFQSNDTELYSKFLNEFPSSKFTDSLNVKIEETEYNRLTSSLKRVDYEKFLIKYPNTIYKIQIEEKIETIKQKEMTARFENCKSDGLCLIEFLKKYPNSNYTNEAVEKILNATKTLFDIGHKDVLKNVYELKEIESLKFDKQKLDYFIHDYEFKIVSKFDNNSTSWDKYINTFPNSEHINEAIMFRDSLIYIKVLNQNTEAEYSNFIQQYPNSKYSGDAQLKINRLRKNQDNISDLEKAFLDKYAIHEGRVLRLFVNENIQQIGFVPDNRELSIVGGESAVEIGPIGKLWAKIEQDSEGGPDQLSELRSDTISVLKLKILGDYGVDLERLINANNSFDVQDALQNQYNKPTIIKNYITTAIIIDSLKNEMLVTGFFVNENHYSKDLDAFVAKIDLNQKDVAKKVIWLKSFSYKNAEGVNINEWSKELIVFQKSSDIIIKLLNNNSQTNLIRINTDGDIVWELNVYNESLDDLLTNTISLSNGNLMIVAHNDYNYGDFDFKLINFQTGKVIKENKSIGNKVTGTLGGVISVKDGFLVVVNFTKYNDINGQEKYSIGRSLNQSCRTCFLPNTMILKYSNSGELIDQKILLSEEPRIITICDNFNNGIRCEGQRGHDGYKYINSFYLEMDTNLKVISANGID